MTLRSFWKDKQVLGLSGIEGIRERYEKGSEEDGDERGNMGLYGKGFSGR
jgi:hypothetical protein